MQAVIDHPLPHVKMPAYGPSFASDPDARGEVGPAGAGAPRFLPLGCLGGGEVEQLAAEGLDLPLQGPRG